MQYFIAHLLHYFYNLKTKCDCQKLIEFLKLVQKIHQIKKEEKKNIWKQTV